MGRQPPRPPSDPRVGGLGSAGRRRRPAKARLSTSARWSAPGRPRACAMQPRRTARSRAPGGRVPGGPGRRGPRPMGAVRPDRAGQAGGWEPCQAGTAPAPALGRRPGRSPGPCAGCLGPCASASVVGGLRRPARRAGGRGWHPCWSSGAVVWWPRSPSCPAGAATVGVPPRSVAMEA